MGLPDDYLLLSAASRKHSRSTARMLKHHRVDQVKSSQAMQIDIFRVCGAGKIVAAYLLPFSGRRAGTALLVPASASAAAVPA